MAFNAIQPSQLNSFAVILKIWGLPHTEVVKKLLEELYRYIIYYINSLYRNLHMEYAVQIVTYTYIIKSIRSYLLLLLLLLIRCLSD